MSKLNQDLPSLWQCPRQGRINYIDAEWYESRPVGHDMLDRFMKINLSKNVTLSREYTNHSIRSTVINNLDKAGFEARHIIQLSSHKSEATIKEYAPKCDENKRKEMFDSLSNVMQPTSKKNKTPTATSAKSNNDDTQTPDILDVKQNLPNFHLDPIDYDTIDDNLLSNLLTDFTDDENSNSNNNNNSNQAMVPHPQNTTSNPNQQFNTQVINQNMPFAYPNMPTMYFPNSNVTINYNFNK